MSDDSQIQNSVPENSVPARANFSSRLGVFVATVGSAVGLGNIWRFPTETAKGGGALFLLIYLVCVACFAIPIMVSEFTIGREGRANTARSFLNIPRGKAFAWVGYLGVLVAFLILCYYVLVAGWTISYLWFSVKAFFATGTTVFEDPKTIFAGLLASVPAQTFGIAGAVFATALVVWFGVRSGIERASKILMPILLIFLLAMCVRAVTLDGAAAGLQFLFKPDFSHISAGTFLAALSQSFFSLSCAIGILVTYASYFKREVNLTKMAVSVSVADTLFAILVGTIIFSTAFAANGSDYTHSLLKGGAELIFVTLPELFNTLPAGTLWATCFFVLVIFAAITSVISLFEVVVIFVNEEFKISRRAAIVVVSIVLFLANVVTATSPKLFDGLDYFSMQILAPIIAFFTSIFVGWVLDKKILENSITSDGAFSGTIVPALRFFIRFVVPAGIFIIFVAQFC